MRHRRGAVGRDVIAALVADINGDVDERDPWRTVVLSPATAILYRQLPTPALLALRAGFVAELERGGLSEYRRAYLQARVDVIGEIVARGWGGWGSSNGER